MKNRKKLLVSIVIILAVAVVLLIVNPFQPELAQTDLYYQQKGEYIRKSPPAMFSGDSNKVSTPEMLTELIKLYGLENLEDFVIYCEGLDVQGEFHFNENVTKSELEIAVRLGYEKLHLGIPNSIMPMAIDGWMLTTDVSNYFDKTDLLFYINDELLLYHHYENMLLTDKHENTAMNLAARIDPDINNFMNGYVIQHLSGMEASAQRSLMGRAVILQISGEEKLDRDSYESLINMLDSDTYIHSLAPGRSHVVLVLVDGDGEIYSEDVFENTDQGLDRQDIDWMALKPYDL